MRAMSNIPPDNVASTVKQIQAAFPSVQAIYRFGSAGTQHERRDSDLDLALLLPPGLARETGSLLLGDLHLALESEWGRNVDLLNLRRVSTVLQKEVVMNGALLFTGDADAVAEFEMHVLSFYQKLNQERAAIIDAGVQEGAFYQP